MKTLMRIDAGPLRILCAMNDTPIFKDEDSRNQVDSVLYLDPAGIIVTVHGNGTVAGFPQAIPKELHGGMLALYRVPISAVVEVCDTGDMLICHDRAGTCGVITKVGELVEWRKDIDYIPTRMKMMRWVEHEPEVSDTLHRMLKEAEEVARTYRSGDKGFMTHLEHSGIFVWSPVEAEPFIRGEEPEMGWVPRGIGEPTDWAKLGMAAASARPVFPRAHRVRRRARKVAGVRA